MAVLSNRTFIEVELEFTALIALPLTEHGGASAQRAVLRTMHLRLLLVKIGDLAKFYCIESRTQISGSWRALILYIPLARRP
jgi:hypothetical protein